VGAATGGRAPFFSGAPTLGKNRRRCTERSEPMLPEPTDLPEPGTWTIDPGHTTIGAIARHLMFTKVRGHFGSFQGAIHVDRTIEDSWAELEIDAASIDTGNADRDAHLKSADFLDVERFPKLTFRSTAVERTGGNTLRVTGDLTIRDRTQSVDLDVSYEGLMPDPWGGTRAGFELSGTIDREAFGMTWNVALETGGVLVSREIEIEAEVQAVRDVEDAERANEAETELDQREIRRSA
jgi:polyisoprenoid-binding protein YceI